MPDDATPIRPDRETRAEERQDAQVAGHADREPTEDEERAAERRSDLDPDVIAHEREMAERGVHQEGEGRIG